MTTRYHISPSDDSPARQVEPQADGSYLIEGQRVVISEPMPGRYRIEVEGKVFDGDLIERGPERGQIRLLIGGDEISLTVKTDLDLMMEKLAGPAGATAKGADLKAPMPGLVRRILTEAGTQVSKGTPVLVLEAMKMENLLKAPHGATVSSILVKEGQAVEKGQVLIRF